MHQIHSNQIMSDSQFHGRLQSNSISSLDAVDTSTLNKIIQLDSKSHSFQKGGEIKLAEDIDVEKQLIIQAGGKRKYLCGFIFKLALLMTVVVASSVLIFYALWFTPQNHLTKEPHHLNILSAYEIKEPLHHGFGICRLVPSLGFLSIYDLWVHVEREDKWVWVNWVYGYVI